MPRSSMLPWGKASNVILMDEAQPWLWNYFFRLQSLGIRDDWRGIVPPLSESFALHHLESALQLFLAPSTVPEMSD